jgi:hypothetical protein
MAILGLLLAVLGLVVSILSLSVTSNPGGRLVIVLVGIALSLFGILGLVNGAYLKRAVWRKK